MHFFYYCLSPITSRVRPVLQPTSAPTNRQALIDHDTHLSKNSKTLSSNTPVYALPMSIDRPVEQALAPPIQQLILEPTVGKTLYNTYFLNIMPPSFQPSPEFNPTKFSKKRLPIKDEPLKILIMEDSPIALKILYRSLFSVLRRGIESGQLVEITLIKKASDQHMHLNPTDGLKSFHIIFSDHDLEDKEGNLQDKEKGFDIIKKELTTETDSLSTPPPLLISISSWDPQTLESPSGSGKYPYKNLFEATFQKPLQAKRLQEFLYSYLYTE